MIMFSLELNHLDNKAARIGDKKSCNKKFEFVLKFFKTILKSYKKIFLKEIFWKILSESDFIQQFPFSRDLKVRAHMINL